MAIYRCGDGGYLHIHTGAQGALDRLFSAVGLDRDRFVAPSSGRHFRGDPEGAERLRAALAEAFATRPRDDWVEALAHADVAAAPCLEPGEALQHPQPVAMDLVVETNDPLLGPVRQAGLPMQFADAPGEVTGAAVRRGMTANPEAALRHSGWPTGEEAGIAAGERATASVTETAAASLAGASTRGPRRDAAPLAGLRVLDFGMFAAGPFAATLLADLGADVIKIEPLAGDTMRPAERNFLGLHRGKRGLALDLKAAAAQAVVDRLVRGADVVVHNLRPGVAERLGIGYDRLAAIAPGLVYCHSTAYGSRGPYASRPGFDQMYQAFCGMEAMQGGSGRPPRQIAGAPLDYANAFLSAAAVLMALRRRAETGFGERIECPQLAAGLLATSDVFAADGGISGRPPLDDAGNGNADTHRLYRCADGWIFVCCPDEAARGAFAALAGTTAEALFSALTTADAIARLAAAGIPAELVRPFAGDALLDDPVLAASGRVVATEHARLGRVRQLGGFVRFSGVPAVATRAVPLVGADTEAILTEIGFSAAEIAALADARVVAWPDDAESAP
jgi:crotonobetainyl-CoA:carnitine CoA-transferase CaiB-like acyl-CoA transferase